MAEPESDNETVDNTDPFDKDWTENEKMGYIKMQMDFLRGRIAAFEKRDLRRENIEMEMHFAMRARLGNDVQAMKAQILAEIVPEVRAQILAEIVPELRAQILAENVPEVRTNPTKEETEVVGPSIVKGSRTRSSVTAPRKRARR